MARYGYKDPNRPRGQVGEDDPLDAFGRPLFGGHDPYSLAALEQYEDLNKGALPDIDTYGARAGEAAEEAYKAGAGAVERQGEEAKSAISASYSRRGLAGSGASSAAMTDAQTKTMARLAEMASGARLQARQYYEQIGLSERAREIARRQFAMQMAYGNKPGENQLLPTLIGIGGYMGGQFMGGLGGALGAGLTGGVGVAGVGGSQAAMASAGGAAKGAAKGAVGGGFGQARQGLTGGGPPQVNYYDPYGTEQHIPEEMTEREAAWLRRMIESGQF